VKTLIKLLFVLLVGCAMERQGVYLKEMETTPILTISNGLLTVNTTNSKENSALLIYKMAISVDINKKEVYITAEQAASKKCLEAFTFQLADYNISDPSGFTFLLG
jgi:ERCC4-type nuclease